MTSREIQIARCSIRTPAACNRRPVLAPPEAFSDEAATEEVRRRFHKTHDPNRLGPDSLAVTLRLGRSCAGWAEKPTSREFYDAVRAAVPDDRQRALLRTWIQEATAEDIMFAWAEGAYTVRQLARGLHASGNADSLNCIDLNGLAAGSAWPSEPAATA